MNSQTKVDVLNWINNGMPDSKIYFTAGEARDVAVLCEIAVLSSEEVKQ